MSNSLIIPAGGQAEAVEVLRAEVPSLTILPVEDQPSQVLVQWDDEDHYRMVRAVMSAFVTTKTYITFLELDDESPKSQLAREMAVRVSFAFMSLNCTEDELEEISQTWRVKEAETAKPVQAGKRRS